MGFTPQQLTLPTLNMVQVVHDLRIAVPTPVKSTGDMKRNWQNSVLQQDYLSKHFLNVLDLFLSNLQKR